MIALHYARYVVRPALAQIGNGARGFETDVATWLVVGTAAAESEFRALDQYTGRGDRTLGPAYGPWQIEKATADDIWDNWLAYRPDWAARMRSLLAPFPDRTTQLATNLTYAAAMCRLRYWREADAKLPARVDRDTFAALWKRFYNTSRGAGSEAEFCAKWDRLVAPYVTETL